MVAYQFSQPWLSKLNDPDWMPTAQEFAHLRAYLQGIDSGTIPFYNLFLTNPLSVPNGGTGFSSIAQGDLLYGSAANVISLLNKNTTATRYLSNTGTTNNPAWAQVVLTDGVSGILPIANGGTNSSTALNNSRVMISSSSKIVEGAASTVNAAGYVIGTVIQIVTANTTTSTSTSSGTYQSTSLTASITPAANTHKIRVTAIGMLEDSATAAADAAVTIFRGSTDLSPAGTSVGMLVITSSGVGIDENAPSTLVFVDSPATTSSTTYTVKIRIQGGAGTVKYGLGGNQHILLEEIAA